MKPLTEEQIGQILGRGIEDSTDTDTGAGAAKKRKN